VSALSLIRCPCQEGNSAGGTRARNTRPRGSILRAERIADAFPTRGIGAPRLVVAEVDLNPGYPPCGLPYLHCGLVARHGGPTGVMLHEHELGRQHVRGMSDSVAAVRGGDATAARGFVEHAQAFIALLRERIQKEDHFLFSMADQAFTPTDQQQLLEAFGRVEAEHMGKGTHEKYVRIADELAARFNVARAEPAAGGCQGCRGR